MEPDTSLPIHSHSGDVTFTSIVNVFWGGVDVSSKTSEPKAAKLPVTPPVHTTLLVVVVVLVVVLVVAVVAVVLSMLVVFAP